MAIEIEKNNNKELVPLEHYLEEFKRANPREICARTGFPYDEEKGLFSVSFLGRDYEVSHPDFKVRCLDGRYGFDPVEKMNPAKILMARFLLEGASASSTGKFLTYREVPWGEVYYRQFHGRCMTRLAFSYGNKLEEFQRASRIMGGIPVKAGDAGFQFEVFPGYAVQFLLWQGDEEFPPSSQILFSDNFPAGFHAEDLVVICDILISTLKQL